MRRRGLKAAVLVGAMAALAACAPTFPDGAQATTSNVGPLVKLSWPAATDPDGHKIDRYLVEVDGNQVALVPAPATSCVLTGLAASTTYLLSITAYDSANEYSGVDSKGRIIKTITTPPASASPGTTKDCVPPTDSDGDRLPNAVETGTGTFTSAAQTGTSPTDTDTDDDGLLDGDEVLGTTAGLALPAFGISPLRKDILLEFDWFVDNSEPSKCASHSHRPSAGAITRLSNAFAAAPVSNPDGSTGVHIVADYGQGEPMTGGTEVADADGILTQGVISTEFDNIKNANTASNRRGYFHYVLMPHRYNTSSNSSGQAEVNGNDLIVSLQCNSTDVNVANTIMHELGHNLGLRHGGNEDRNYKPNYNSVMNYRYQFPGVDNNCTPAGNGVLDFSTGARAALDENALLEPKGICGDVPVDWNGNSTIEAEPVQADINNADGLFSVLTDWNDWASLNFNPVTGGDGAPTPRERVEVITEQDTPGS